MRGNNVEGPIAGSHISHRSLNVQEASAAIMSSMQGKRRLPSRLYKVVSRIPTGAEHGQCLLTCPASLLRHHR